MPRVAVVDYGLCNLDSVRRAIEECGATAEITADPAVVARANRVVLPGVGAFDRAMQNLAAAGLDEALTKHVVIDERPFLGICLGLQLICRSSEEGGGQTSGLGWIDADVRRLVPPTGRERVPHIGWNRVDVRRPNRLLAGVPDDADFYFVHSYHAACADPDDVVATTPYCGEFASVIERGNVVATQFHPEKSQRLGFVVLRNFLAA